MKSVTSWFSLHPWQLASLGLCLCLVAIGCSSSKGEKMPADTSVAEDNEVEDLAVCEKDLGDLGETADDVDGAVAIPPEYLQACRTCATSLCVLSVSPTGVVSRVACENPSDCQDGSIDCPCILRQYESELTSVCFDSEILKVLAQQFPWEISDSLTGFLDMPGSIYDGFSFPEDMPVGAVVYIENEYGIMSVPISHDDLRQAMSGIVVERQLDHQQDSIRLVIGSNLPEPGNDECCDKGYVIYENWVATSGIIAISWALDSLSIRLENLSMQNDRNISRTIDLHEIEDVVLTASSGE